MLAAGHVVKFVAKKTVVAYPDELEQELRRREGRQSRRGAERGLPRRASGQRPPSPRGRLSLAHVLKRVPMKRPAVRLAYESSRFERAARRRAAPFPFTEPANELASEPVSQPSPT